MRDTAFVCWSPALVEVGPVLAKNTRSSCGGSCAFKRNGNIFLVRSRYKDVVGEDGRGGALTRSTFTERYDFKRVGSGTRIAKLRATLCFSL